MVTFSDDHIEKMDKSETLYNDNQENDRIFYFIRVHLL